MPGNAHAISLPRLRRKRKKPMPPWLKVMIILIAVELAMLGWCAFDIARGEEPIWNSIIAGLYGFWLARDWPRFKAMWDEWRRDEDE